jgi:UDP-glucose 4-epimerase
VSRVLVTGGAGFVGVALIAELTRRGHVVAVLDDFSGAERARLDPLAGPDGLGVHEADLRDHVTAASAVAAARPEAIVHLAARHYIPWCEANPAETHAINVEGTENLLEAAGTVGVERILLASTADVYAPGTRPHAESDRLAPPSVYGASKLAAEERLAAHLARHPDATGRALRLFNVYGPGETNPHVLPAILEQLHAGDVLELGNTDARRDWLYVGDAARAIAGLLDLPGREPVNLAGGRAASVGELIEAIARITGRELRVEHDPERMRPSDRPVLAADLTRLGGLLPDFTPTVLDEGLRRTLEAEDLA